MQDIIITFQQEGGEVHSFRVPAAVTAKLDAYIADRRATFPSRASWFEIECSQRLFQPLLDRSPDPPPAEAGEKLAQAARLQEEAARIIAAAAVQPIIPVPPTAIRERR